MCKRSGQCSHQSLCVLGSSGSWQKLRLGKQINFITGSREKVKTWRPKRTKGEYREENLRPPEKENYRDWRFLVDMWMKACDRAKLPRADRGYALFQRLKDIKKDNVGNKLVTAA